jgi:RNA polymerase primary sigma factor
MEPKREDDALQRRYFKEINRYPLLSPEEELELARRVRAGDPEARRKLIVANLRLVITIARTFSSYGVPFLDLVEEGNLGLIKAVGRYDPDRGFRFSTYASWWIRQAMVRAISNYSRTIRIPIHIFQLMTRYVALGQEPGAENLSPEDRAKRLKISMKRYRMLVVLVENIRALDLANSIDAYEQLTRSMEPDSGNDPEKIILQQMEHENFAEIMERLSDRERLILRIRYGFDDGEPHTLAETGDAVKVSRERVRQLEMRALRKLRFLLGIQRESNADREEGR